MAGVWQGLGGPNLQKIHVPSESQGAHLCFRVLVSNRNPNSGFTKPNSEVIVPAGKKGEGLKIRTPRSFLLFGLGHPQAYLVTNNLNVQIAHKGLPGGPCSLSPRQQCGFWNSCIHTSKNTRVGIQPSNPLPSPGPRNQTKPTADLFPVLTEPGRVFSMNLFNSHSSPGVMNYDHLLSTDEKTEVQRS